MPSNMVNAALTAIAIVVSALGTTTLGPSTGGSVKNIRTITRA